MKEDKREGTFIPCGDSLEKMEEISEEDLEGVSGGETAGSGLHSRLGMTVCPACGQETYVVSIVSGKRHCLNCRYSEN